MKNLFKHLPIDRPLRFLSFITFLLLIWSIAAWNITEYYSEKQMQAAYAYEHELANEQLYSISNGIDERLKVVRSLAVLLISDARVVDQLKRFQLPLPADKSPETKRRLTADSELAKLDAYLALAANKMGADILWLINPAGDAISASNFDKPTSLVGTNFAGRQYFTQARTGREGVEYAIGRLTHLPGLFYSAPLMESGKFMGTMVAKIDVNNLNTYLHSQQAFMADINGVIVLTADKSFENKTVPDASALYLPEAEKLEQYQQHAFEPLPVQPWNNGQFKNVVVIGNNQQPGMLVSKDLVDAGIALYVSRPIPELVRIQSEQKWIFLLLFLVGSIFISAATVAIAVSRWAYRREKIKGK